jgi:RNA polymerase sigma factor (sigma-70 family)
MADDRGPGSVTIDPRIEQTARALFAESRTREGLELLVGGHYPQLLRIAGSVTPSGFWFSPRDALHELCRKLLVRAATGRPLRTHGNLAKFFAVVLRRIVIDFLRKEARRGVDELGVDADPTDPKAGAIADAIGEVEQSNRIVAALADLERNQRIALELLFLKGLSYREIAKHLAVKLKTVSTLVQRGKRRIRNRFALELEELNR